MNKSHLHVLCLTLFFVSCTFQGEQPEKYLWESPEFTVTHNRVEQNGYVATASSAWELSSTYQSSINQFKSPRIDFKFSINARDNEMISGRDHSFVYLPSSATETPTITFGTQYLDTTKVQPNTYLPPNAPLTIRLDMRHVFEAFEIQGYFDTKTGERIYEHDFKGVYVAGSTAPLTWDFDNLWQHEDLKLVDEDGDHIFQITLVMNGSKGMRSNASHWKLSADIGSFPQYESNAPLLNAIYNLSLQEMLGNIEPDSTFRTGKEWAGVWTRDISYSIILSMAILQPDVARFSLLKKVKNGMIVQDTGTGGAYPVSTDRVIWAVAAWELFNVTGDTTWLKEAYPIIKKSLHQDVKNIVDPVTGLIKGESSFLDWREQTYPVWMEPADIFDSECLGTNVVHYQAHMILSAMATVVGEPEIHIRHRALANKIKEGINRYLWLPEKGYYAQYRYGRNYKILSPKSEALGEALSVLFGVADGDKDKQVINNAPVNDFGIPCIYPQIPGIPPYHNDAVWPFVQAYWTLAAAKAGNGEAVMASLGAMYRSTALFLTNKENFVASTGDYASTQINSDNMLWSISGNIAMVYKVLFGIQYKEDGLYFFPFVPKALRGKHILTNFTYRNAHLDITLEGYGNKISSITLDGKPLDNPRIDASLSGKHTIKIVLQENDTPGKSNNMPGATAPESPQVKWAGQEITWEEVKGVKEYIIIRNGVRIASTSMTNYRLDQHPGGEYQVIAIDSQFNESFASKPISTVPSHFNTIFELEKILPKATHAYAGFSGTGYVEISMTENTTISIPITILEDGYYSIDIRYANGNGPVNTQNKCAMRSIIIDNVPVGVLVFPQRGLEEWSDWGYSNKVKLKLTKGIHNITLSLDPENENMNGKINQAMIDYLRFVKLE